MLLLSIEPSDQQLTFRNVRRSESRPFRSSEVLPAGAICSDLPGDLLQQNTQLHLEPSGRLCGTAISEFDEAPSSTVIRNSRRD